MTGLGAIPVVPMPITDTAPLEAGPVDYLTESLHRRMLGGDLQQERAVCPLATTRELPIVED